MRGFRAQCKTLTPECARPNAIILIVQSCANDIPRADFQRVGEWLSLVEHLVRDQGVGGSNPLSPTNISRASVNVYSITRIAYVNRGAARWISMLLQSLREEVLEANLELVRHGLVLYTFGNASGISRKNQMVAIKPSGVPYDQLALENIVVTNLEGRVVDGNLRPSSDLATHLELHKHFPSVGGVAHTHSGFATAWAQARCPIPCFGTTHANSFHGRVPVTDDLTPTEIESDKGKNTGLAICRLFKNHDVPNIPAALVAGYAPFCWAANAIDAAHTAVILEYVAKMALYTVGIEPDSQPISQELHNKHYLRKHGRGAYYRQVSNQ